MFHHTGGAKIIGPAANGKHHGVVIQMPFFKQQLVVFFHQRGKGNALVGPVQMRNFAITEAEAVGCGVGDKRNPVVFVPGGSSGKAVEHGFPHMAEAFVHQRDFQPAGAAERVARRVARARPATPPPIITSRNLFVISFLSFVSPFWPEGEAVLRYVVFCATARRAGSGWGGRSFARFRLRWTGPAARSPHLRCQSPVCSHPGYKPVR